MRSRLFRITAALLLIFLGASCSSANPDSSYVEDEWEPEASSSESVASDTGTLQEIEAEDSNTADVDAYVSSYFDQATSHSSDNASNGCYGTSSYRTCTDKSGNTYTTQRIGDSSFTDGSNPVTGSNWSQSTQHIGDSSFTTGYDADGNSWNSTTQTIGDTTFQNGTDSEGNSFSRTCTEYGCY